MQPFCSKSKFLAICLATFCLFPLIASAESQQPKSSDVSKSVVAGETICRWELRAAPAQLIYRFYSVEFAYRLSKQWSLGPSVVVYDSPGNLGGMFGPTYHGAAFGLNGTYYFKSAASNSSYLSTRVFYQSYTSYGHNSRGYTENTGGRGDVVLGYQWRWNNFFSLRFGGGVQLEAEDVRTVTPGISALEPDTIESSRRTGLFPTIELKVGIEI